jgi:hypothetical protein
MRMALRAVPVVGLVGLIGLVSPRFAFAQSDAENRATARALAQQGGEALEAKDYAKAEDSFRRANALFHAPTLVLGMARAQAAEGKFVESWESYNQIVLEGVTSTPVFQKALDDAKREIANVDGRRSRITVTVAGATSARVTLDDGALKPEALGVPLFVNPGTHTIVAAADGFNPSTRTLSVAEGREETVAIALEPAAAVAAAPTSAPAPAVSEMPSSAQTRPRGASHVPAFIAFGVGGVGLIAGVVEGLAALGKHSTLKTDCTVSGTMCPASDKSTIDAYHTAGLISTVGFVVAGVGAAAGITLWIVESKQPTPTSASIAPYVGLGSVGAVGRF